MTVIEPAMNRISGPLVRTWDYPNGSFNGQTRFLRTVHDQLNVVLERFSSGEALAADDFAPDDFQFTCLRLITGRPLSTVKTDAGY